MGPRFWPYAYQVQNIVCSKMKHGNQIMKNSSYLQKLNDKSVFEYIPQKFENELLDIYEALDSFGHN
jgi:hypothetical protein